MSNGLMQLGSPVVTYEALGNLDELEETRFMLDQWSARNEGHHHQKRGSERFDYRNRPILSVSEKNSQRSVCATGPLSFEVWGRDLSRSGASFLCPTELVACQLLEDNAPMVRVPTIIRESDHVTIALEQPSGQWLELSAQVLRVRVVHDDHYEIGVRFIDRV